MELRRVIFCSWATKDAANVVKECFLTNSYWLEWNVYSWNEKNDKSIPNIRVVLHKLVKDKGMPKYVATCIMIINHHTKIKTVDYRLVKSLISCRTTHSQPRLYTVSVKGYTSSHLLGLLHHFYTLILVRQALELVYLPESSIGW